MAQRAPDSLISGTAGRRYWEGVNADVSGMLGGLPGVSRADLVGSRAFLAKMGIGGTKGLRKLGRVLEGGAGCVDPLLPSPSFPFLPFSIPVHSICHGHYGLKSKLTA